MKKFAVFTKSVFVPQFELSVSNKILEREDFITVLGIVRDWVHTIDKDCLVYFKGNVETATIDQITISKPNCIGDKVSLAVIHKENNVRFRLGVYQNKYSTEEVQERGNK